MSIDWVTPQRWANPRRIKIGEENRATANAMKWGMISTVAHPFLVRWRVGAWALYLMKSYVFTTGLRHRGETKRLLIANCGGIGNVER